jgi:hypothetical protein
MKKNPQFSIVIPTFNGKKLLADCLSSIENQTEKNFEVIVIDNGSNDQTADFLHQNFSKVKIITLKKSAGFAKPVNLGIKASKGNYIFLLNNDVVLDQRCLAEIARRFDSQRDFDFCACLMLDKTGKKIDSVGNGFSWWGRAYPIGRGEIPQKYQKETFVFGASGGAAIFKREVFAKIGLLDEDFYAYFEDVDFSFRAQLAGFRCLFVPKAIVYHQGSATFRPDSFKMRYIGDRNKDWVIFKNYPGKFILINIHKLILVKIKSLAIDFLQGLFFAGLRAIVDEIIYLPKLLQKRRQIQSLRKVSDRYLRTIINPSHPKLLPSKARRKKR